MKTATSQRSLLTKNMCWNTCFRKWSAVARDQIGQVYCVQVVRAQNLGCHVLNLQMLWWMCVMMLQTANWMLSYLLKAQLIKLVETDTLEKRIYYILSFLIQGKNFSKWVFTLILWPEDTNININTEYHAQSHKQTKAQLTCKWQIWEANTRQHN